MCVCCYVDFTVVDTALDECKQGRRKGGEVRTILKARRWEGAPEGET